MNLQLARTVRLTERKNIEMKLQQERQRAEMEKMKMQFDDALKIRRKPPEKPGAKPPDTVPDQF